MLLLAGLAWAGQEWKKEQAWKDFRQYEVKTLTPLLRSAVKEDYRRQAWYLADRVLAADPAHGEAQGILEKWSDTELQQGQVPKSGWISRAHKVLEELGDQWFHYGETLNGAGIDPVDYYEVNVRAHSYGSRNPTLWQAIQEAGHAWCGTFCDPTREEVDRALAPDLSLEQVLFPPEYDDRYLGYRIRWPSAKVAVRGDWRLVTDLKAEEALRLLSVLAAVESHLVETLGGSTKEGGDPTDFLVFLEPKDYDGVAEPLVPEADRPEFAGSSAFAVPWERRLFALWRHRTNGWIGEDASVLAAAVPEIARRRLGNDFRGMVRGRGAWILEGLAGAYQGFVRGTEKGEAPEIDPGRCWLLAAGRALRAENALLPWDELIEMDREEARKVKRRTVSVPFRGATYEAKEVSPVAAQATALVVAILRSESGKSAKKFGRVLQELFKRDCLPDLDKDLGWKRGRAFDEANRALDAAHGR
jgi:hypothetical protein